MKLWPRADILSEIQADFKHADAVDTDSIAAFREKRASFLTRDCWGRLQQLLVELPVPSAGLSSQLNQATVQVGKEADLSSAQQVVLSECLRELIPWRKGPFEICGQFVDSEWQSNQKWDRIEPYLGEVRGRRILDIGCGNGYYMFRTAHLKPKCVLGIDPSLKFYLAFELVQRFLQASHLQYETLGVEHLPFFKKVFDTVLCMGVLYHQSDPIRMIKHIREVLRPGGRLVLESFVFPGDESTAFFPPDRYAKARNVYFIPTVTCLDNMLARAGFVERELISHSVTQVDEQRRTTFAPFESLSDFLDPTDSSQTIEGFPAPQRAAFLARLPA